MGIQEQTEQRFQLNPHPKKAYRIKIKINDIPGPLILTQNFYMRYMARNCSYLITSKIVGATTEPTKFLDYPLTKTGKDEYEAVVYSDAVLDEDYFGEGVCHWEADGFGGIFKATGKAEETGFTFSDLMKNLLEQKKLVKYYWKRDYPYSRKRDGSIYADSTDFGIVSPESYSPEEKRQNFFSITVTLEEVK